MALFNFTGLVLFSGAEIWASLSEPSANLQPTPADKAVLAILGLPAAPVSPTVVVVAFLLPFASLYYGFSRQQRRATEEERAEQAAQEDFALRRKLARAEATARLRAVQAAGFAGAIRAGVQAVRAGVARAESAPIDAAGAPDAAAAPVEVVPEDEEAPRRPLGLARRA
jgi:hypothetical protein